MRSIIFSSVGNTPKPYMFQECDSSSLQETLVFWSMNFDRFLNNHLNSKFESSKSHVYVVTCIQGPHPPSIQNPRNKDFISCHNLEPSNFVGKKRFFFPHPKRGGFHMQVVDHKNVLLTMDCIALNINGGMKVPSSLECSCMQ